MSTPTLSGHGNPLPLHRTLRLRYPLEGHEGHASHCPFCYIRYFIVGIAKGAAPRLAPKPEKELFKEQIWWRTLSRSIIFVLGLSIAYFALYRGSWTLVWAVSGKGNGEVFEGSKGRKGNGTGEMSDAKGGTSFETAKFNASGTMLRFCLFLLVCSPASMCTGFISVGIYYLNKNRKKEKEKNITRVKENLKAIAKHNEDPLCYNPPSTPSSNTSASPHNSPSLVPTITLSHVDTVRQAPCTPRAPSFVSSIGRYWEDKTYKWKPQARGYRGAKQRRSDFENEEDGIEMASLGDEANDGVQVHRPLKGGAGKGLGLFVVDEEFEGELGTERKKAKRERPVTEFPWARS